MKTRVFIDLDGVVVDFARFMAEHNMTGDQVKALPGAYFSMKPIPGALEAVRSIIGAGYEVWIATKPPTGIAFAYGDKAEWVLQHLPELKRRIIVTHHKGMLGRPGDWIIDDRPHKAFIDEFEGTVIHFGGDTGTGWPQTLKRLGIGLTHEERQQAEIETLHRMARIYDDKPNSLLDEAVVPVQQDSAFIYRRTEELPQ